MNGAAGDSTTAALTITMIKRITIITAFLFLLCSCSNKYYLEKTSYGKNSLAFTINGELITHVHHFIGGSHASAYKKGNDLHVVASLDHDVFYGIMLSVPADQADKGITLHPVVSFEYYSKHTKEYKEATIEEATLLVRRLDYEKSIFSGDFTIKGYYENGSGKATHFIVSDGVFDMQIEYYPSADE